MLIVPGKGQRIVMPNREQRRAVERELPREEKIKREKQRQHELRTIKMMNKAEPHFKDMLDKHVPAWSKRMASIVLPKWYAKYMRLALANLPPNWWGYASSRIINLIFGLPMNALLRFAYTLIPALLTPVMVVTGLVACVARMVLYVVLLVPLEWLHKRFMRLGITIRCEELPDERRGVLVIYKWWREIDRTEWSL
jgi:hypothetical protein